MTSRPTSEGLVETAAKLVGDRPARVADVGTGSGAIGVALAMALPRAEDLGH
jgi:release factor glutamine methyltransferase